MKNKLLTRSNGGFSLVELIVVIAIMAILVGVAVPVYSSYIEKANKAKDEQLLGEINSAFNVACVENRIDINTLTAQTAKIDIKADGTVDLSTMLPEVCRAAMQTVLGSDLKFTTIDAIYFNEQTHKFDTTMVVSYGGGYLTLSPEDIAALNASGFGNIGMEELLSKVDLATQLGLSASEGSSMYALVFSSSNYDALAKYLGYDSYDAAGAAEAVEALILKKVEEMLPAGKTLEDLTEDEFDAYFATAEQSILTNNAVLMAATNSTISSDFVDDLKNGTAEATIRANVGENGDTDAGIGQAAMAYAMYTSYYEYKNQTPPVGANGQPTLTDVYSVLSSDDFKEYMATPQAEKDIAGYQAGMNMVNNSSKDKNAVTQLLVNGFGDPTLSDLLGGVTDN